MVSSPHPLHVRPGTFGIVNRAGWTAPHCRPDDVKALDAPRWRAAAE